MYFPKKLCFLLLNNVFRNYIPHISYSYFSWDVAVSNHPKLTEEGNTCTHTHIYTHTSSYLYPCFFNLFSSEVLYLRNFYVDPEHTWFENLDMQIEPLLLINHIEYFKTILWLCSCMQGWWECYRDNQPLFA